jgi:hypothetical protein
MAVTFSHCTVTLTVKFKQLKYFLPENLCGASHPSMIWGVSPFGMGEMPRHLSKVQDSKISGTQTEVNCSTSYYRFLILYLKNSFLLTSANLTMQHHSYNRVEKVWYLLEMLL